jgi:hypothetical protein
MPNRRPLTGFVALGAVVALVVACSGTAAPATSTAAPTSSVATLGPPAATPSPSPSPTATAKPTPTPPPTPSPTPAPVSLTLSSHVWWGGYAIDVSGATYDPLKRKLVITATFVNSGTGANDVSGLGTEVNVVWNSTYLQGYIPVGAVPAGGTVRAEIQLQPPAGFTPETAVLTFGQPTEHQATVPLNGSATAFDPPSDLAVTGTVKMGNYVTFNLTSGLVIPASCSGNLTKMKFGPIKKDEVSIVLRGTAANSEPRSDGYIDQGYVVAPDRTTSAATPAVYMVVPSKATLRDIGLCFNVAAPAKGAYKLVLHESRSKVEGSLAFQVP